MENIKPGMYCVIGNIVKEHTDEKGIIRYGTASFPGGRKVYISRRLWANEVVENEDKTTDIPQKTCGPTVEEKHKYSIDEILEGYAYGNDRY